MRGAIDGEKQEGMQGMRGRDSESIPHSPSVFLRLLFVVSRPAFSRRRSPLLPRFIHSSCLIGDQEIELRVNEDERRKRH